MKRTKIVFAIVVCVFMLTSVNAVAFVSMNDSYDYKSVSVSRAELAEPAAPSTESIDNSEDSSSEQASTNDVDSSTESPVVSNDDSSTMRSDSSEGSSSVDTDSSSTDSSVDSDSSSSSTCVSCSSESSDTSSVGTTSISVDNNEGSSGAGSVASSSGSSQSSTVTSSLDESQTTSISNLVSSMLSRIVSLISGDTGGPGVSTLGSGGGGDESGSGVLGGPGVGTLGYGGGSNGSESDPDGDGWPTSSDNCPYVYNPGQGDYDGDGVGDVCDPDDDNDGYDDDEDCAPFNSAINPGATEILGDGIDNDCDGLVDESGSDGPGDDDDDDDDDDDPGDDDDDPGDDDDDPTYYTLTMSVDGCGSTSPSGSSTHAAGAVVEISASPCDGWNFTTWTGEDLWSPANPTTITMLGDMSITAVFEEVPEEEHSDQVYLQVSDTGPGSVGIMPASLYDGGWYDIGITVKLTAVPDNSSVTWEWSGDYTGTAKTIYAIMDQNRSYHCHFEYDPENDSLDSTTTSAEQSVTTSSVSETTVDQSNDFNSVYIVNSDLSSFENGNTGVNDIGVTGDQYLLTVSSGGPGTVWIQPAPSYDGGWYDAGTTVKLIALPDNDDITWEWSGDVSGSGKTKYVIMNQDCTVHCAFEEDDSDESSLSSVTSVASQLISNIVNSHNSNNLEVNNNRYSESIINQLMDYGIYNNIINLLSLTGSHNFNVLTSDNGNGNIFTSSNDYDNDGVPNSEDNCPYTWNPLQWDSDDDGIGNTCDDTPYGSSSSSSSSSASSASRASSSSGPNS